MNARSSITAFLASGLLFMAAIGCGSAGRPVGTETGPIGSLRAGDPAPALNVAHWITNAEGKHQPVTTFEPGKVYVVEFWATWCPPCRDSIPHLAELQERYGDEVQIIGISDEDPQTVAKFLKSRATDRQTFGDFVSKYSLCADPDGSSQNDYSAAAGQNGIPHAFIVGKDSRIAWIGHPIEMEAPLDAAIHASAPAN